MTSRNFTPKEPSCGAYSLALLSTRTEGAATSARDRSGDGATEFPVMAIGVEESVSWKKVVQRTTLVSEPNMAEILSIEQMQLVQSLSVVASNLLTAPGFVQIQISIPERVQT